MAKNTGSPVRTGIFRVLPGPDRKPGINNFKDRRPDLNPPVWSGSVHSGPVQVQIQVWTDLCTPLARMVPEGFGWMGKNGVGAWAWVGREIMVF